MTGPVVREGFGNELLRRLARSDAELLAPYLRPVELKFRQQLEKANRPIEAVYFPESGLASVITSSTSGRRQAEVGMIGREGMTGRAVILGLRHTSNDVFVQLPGRGFLIFPIDLQQAMAESCSLTSHFLHYLHCFTLQIEQTALANSEGRIEERLARWLLMAHDRIEGDDVVFTHELIALLLGIRRAGVTGALSELEAKGLIATSRKLITILDRAGLEAAAGGLYGAPEAEYKRVFGRAET